MMLKKTTTVKFEATSPEKKGILPTEIRAGKAAWKQF
jgi:hypothetical protein